MAKVKFDTQQPVIVLDVTLVGLKGAKRRVRMALDTGATYTMIPWEVAEALGYKPELSKEKVTLVTASGIETAPVIKVRKIGILGEYIEDIFAVCHDLPPKSYVVGLLGSTVLRHFRITIDYGEGSLELVRIE
ncbi:MAG: retropepsin-like aspartic protease [Nitrospirota bacterium]